MATITAQAGGWNWNTNGAWVGGVQPTAADDVIVPTGSAIGIPASTTAVCRSLSVTGTGTVAFAATTSSLNIGDASGGALSIDASATITLTAVGTVSFVSTSSNGGSGWAVTTGGKTLPNVTFSGAGGKWTLQDALTVSGAVTLTSGEFDTNSQSVTAASFVSNNSNTRTVTLGSSSVTLSGGGTVFNASTTTGLTVTANTATITTTGTSVTSNFGGFDWNGLSVVSAGAGNASFAGAGSTLANLTRTGTAVKTDALFFNASYTVTGTFTVNGNSVTNRVLVRSNTEGTARTITAAVVSMSNVDFADITGAGAASWNLSAITGGSGDAGGNSGITFTTAQTNYAIAAAAWDSASSWSLSSGGAAGGRVPLPQDTARLDASSPAGTYTPIAGGRYGALDCTGFTRTLSFANAASWHGSWTLGSGSTVSGTGTQTLASRGSRTFTTNGKTVTCGITVAAVSGTYTLQDALTTNRSAAGAITVTSGTLDTNSQTVTFTTTSGMFSIAGGTLTATNSSIVATGASSQFALSAGTLNASGATFSMGGTNPFTFWNVTGGTLNGAPNVTLSVASSNTRTFAGNGQTYGALTYTVAASTGQLSIAGANTFDTINVSGGSRTIAFTAGTTTTVSTAFSVFGTAGNLVTIGSLTAASHTLAKAGGGVIDDVDYVSISRSTATPGSTWYAGANSTDGGNNSGWTFTAAPSGGVTGTGSSVLGGFTQAATGTFEPENEGTAASVLAAFTQSATGTRTVPTSTGTATSTFGPFTQTAEGTNEPEYEGEAAGTIGPFTQSAAGTRTVPTSTGTAASTLGPFSQTATGTHEPLYTGTAGSTLQPFTQSAAGTRTVPTFTGTTASVLLALTQSATGTFADFDYGLAPLERTIRVPAEARTVTVAAENRTVRVPAEPRALIAAR